MFIVRERCTKKKVDDTDTQTVVFMWSLTHSLFFLVVFRVCESGSVELSSFQLNISIPIVSPDLPVVVTVVAVLGKYSITSALSIIYIYTAELFPTSLR